MLTTAQAPEIELPTFDGGTFALSSLLGTRVILVAWASWCGCAHDLPLWQELRERIRPLGVEIVTVAMDTAGPEAGRQFVERAAPRHPALIDVAHILGERLGVTNVPSGIWIDEDGMIVRPPETAFPGRAVVFEELRQADLERETNETGNSLTLTREVLKSDEEGLTPEVLERLEMTRGIAAAAEPELYLEMVLDWAHAGRSSKYVLSAEDVVERSSPRTLDVATAAAHFEIGQHLQNAGDHAGAVAHWRRAHELQPLNWTYKRQAWRYEYGEDGDPSLYDGSMEKDLREVGPGNYFHKLRP
ncbi:ResA-like WAxxUGC motif-containing protein, partial [Gordonia hydrophobica]|uniref:ResA-like WAxxUGC motif-containing protein n=1 Tax=Gordonia hydrophobica TaxID=40516 RepID=A0ABZ2TZF8_9ACTN